MVHFVPLLPFAKEEQRLTARQRLNQQLETGYASLAVEIHLCGPKIWVAFAHNSLPSKATGMTPFHTVLDYQPPLFPSLESEVVVPSAAALVHRCHLAWQQARCTKIEPKL